MSDEEGLAPVLSKRKAIGLQDSITDWHGRYENVAVCGRSIDLDVVKEMNCPITGSGDRLVRDHLIRADIKHHVDLLEPRLLLPGPGLDNDLAVALLECKVETLPVCLCAS
jgi:hypothetical protein